MSDERTLAQVISDMTSDVQALITYSNTVTGEEDTSLGDCVERLADGYGSGGDFTKEDIEKFLENSSVDSDDNYFLHKIFSIARPTSLRIYAITNMKYTYDGDLQIHSPISLRNGCIFKLTTSSTSHERQLIIGDADGRVTLDSGETIYIDASSCFFKKVVCNNFYHNTVTNDVKFIYATSSTTSSIEPLEEVEINCSSDLSNIVGMSSLITDVASLRKLTINNFKGANNSVMNIVRDCGATVTSGVKEIIIPNFGSLDGISVVVPQCRIKSGTSGESYKYKMELGTDGVPFTSSACSFWVNNGYVTSVRELYLRGGFINASSGGDTLIQRTNQVDKILVHEDVIETYINDTNWSAIASKFIPIELQDITGLNISNIPSDLTIPLFSAKTYSNFMEYEPYNRIKEEQKGYTISCDNEHVTIDGESFSILYDSECTDTITLTFTSTYDPSITASKTMNITAKFIPTITNEANSTYVEDTIGGVECYLIRNGSGGAIADNGIAGQKVEFGEGFVGKFVQFKVYNSSEYNYDYASVSKKNLAQFTYTAMRNTSSQSLTGKGTNASWKTGSKIQITSAGDYFYVAYSKDGSSSSGTDKGYWTYTVTDS